MEKTILSFPRVRGELFEKPAPTQHPGLYDRLRPWIFRLDPEVAHDLTLLLLQIAGQTLPGRLAMQAIFPRVEAVHPVSVFGLTFPNPVGLAAGYDKNGTSWRGLGLLGFGHVEVGTVTPRPQPGNPRPRIFRLVEEQGVINRMGFPNQGAEAVLPRLKSPRRGGLVLGVNIGKNKDTPLEAACEDYLDLLRQFAPVADYLTINVSSPNTQGLRLLQTRAALYGLLPPLAAEREHLRRELGKPLPLLVKLAPDLSPVELDGALQAVLDTGMDGVVLSNTTIKRDHVDSPVQKETGGLSGAPLKERSTEMIRQVSYRTCGKLPIVANGGIMSPEDAREKMEAGASLVQLYSGLIYRGPGLVRQILMS